MNMDCVKLVQICSTYRHRRLNNSVIAKGVNVHYNVPDGPAVFIPGTDLEINRRDNYSGYNCLHFAVFQRDPELVDYFLSKGADLMKQGTFDGYTPIHLSIVHTHRIFNLPKCTCAVLDSLKNDKIINMLLSAHVSSGNVSNPRCNIGLSHFEAACVVDHVEAIEFFLKNGVPIDHTTDANSLWPGYTPLHFAVKYASTRAVELLLKHGANMLNKDSKGQSPLGLATECLIDVYNSLLLTPMQKYYDTYEGIISQMDAIINSMIRMKICPNENIVKFISDDGLTICHLASMIKDQSIMDKVIDKNFDLNAAVKNDSRFWPGWTPLHFAACTSHERFKMLLQHGAQINIKNVNGDTPLDLLMKRFCPKIVYSILSTKDDLKKIMLSDNQTKLIDAVLALQSRMRCRDLIDFLPDTNAIIPVSSQIWPGYNLLHLAMSSKRACQWGSDSHGILHETLHDKIIEILIDKDCRLDAQDAINITPIHMAFKWCQDCITSEKTAEFDHGKYRLESFLIQCENDAADLDNLSIFHMACMLNNLDLVERLLAKAVDINRRVNREFNWLKRQSGMGHVTVTIRAGSTALHMAVLCENEEIIKLLVEHDADVLAKDSIGLTPLHLALPMFNYNARTMTELLLSLTPELPDIVSDNGLSHVHLAAFANDENKLQDLIDKGANVNIATSLPLCYAGQTPLHVATWAGSAKAVKLLINAGANVHAENTVRKYETPLLYSLHQKNAAEHFLEKLKVNDFVDPSGATLLHLACASLDLEFAKELLEKGVDPNAVIRTDLEFDMAGFTPLHVLVNHQINVLMLERLEDFLKLMLKFGADVTIMSKRKGTPLHLAHRGPADVMRNLAELMLKSQLSYDVNPIDNSEFSIGFSHFHIACVVNDVETVRKFLDNGVDVNHMVNPFVYRNPGCAGLHFTCVHKCLDVARLLTQSGADVKLEDSIGNTPLHIAMANRMIDMEFIKILLVPGSRSDSRNLEGMTALDCHIERIGYHIQSILFYLRNGCSLGDMYTRGLCRGIIGEILKNVQAGDTLSVVIDHLIEACNFQRRIEYGFNPIYNAVLIDGNLIEQLVTADTYVMVFLRFIELGCDIDHRDSQGFIGCLYTVLPKDFKYNEGLEKPNKDNTTESGLTPLHAAVELYNYGAVRALLELGADINLSSILADSSQNTLPFSDGLLRRSFRSDDSRAQVADLLANHVWKMKLVGFELHRENVKRAESLFFMRLMDADFPDICQAELKRMEGVSIDATLKLKDLLVKPRFVTEYPMMPIARKEAVENYFEDTFLNIRKEFPQFCGLLMMKYRQIQKRIRIWEEAKLALIYLADAELPDLCSEEILLYLDNNEIGDLLGNVAVIQKEDEDELPVKKSRLSNENV